MDQKEQSSVFNELTISHSIGNHVFELSKWARFLSVLGIVIMSILLVCFAAMGTNYLVPALKELIPGSENLLSSVLLGVILLVSVIGITLFYFLLRFAILIRRGVELRNLAIFKEGLKAFRTYMIIYALFAAASVILNLFNLFIF